MIMNVAYSLQQEFALLPVATQEAWLAEQSLETLEEIARGEWWWVSRPEQVPPETDYSVFLYLAGRGAGKTRSGAEWVVERCLRYPLTTSSAPTEHLIVAKNLEDARKVCMEGESGILRVLARKGLEEKKDFIYTRSPKPKIIFLKHGTKIYTAGADNEDCGRGPNHTSLWLDEVIAWPKPMQTWKEGLRPSLRGAIEGDRPRAFVTTTPKPIDILHMWLATADGSVAISRGSTFDNVMGLPEEYLEDMRREYGDSALGRQELYGEMLESLEGALFGYNYINRTRVDIGPEKVTSRVVAVDPSLTGDEDGDEMGVVVVLRDHRDHMYVLEDASMKLVGRDAALHCWRVFERHGADVLVYENNLGHAWMEQVLRDAYRELQKEGFFPDNTNPPLKAIRSYQGKQLRAEPVAMRYQQGRIHMIGTWPELEKQLVSWDPLSSRDSPDRLDAFVHACRFLMEGERSKARILSPAALTITALQPGIGRGSVGIRRF
jgi:phage terminase large subunit-like protein